MTCFKSRFLATLIPLTLFVSSVSGHPLFRYGDDISVYFHALAEARYESNVFYDENNEKDDFYTILGPGAEIVYGNKRKPMFFKGLFREDIYVYNKHSSLNRQEANVFLKGGYNHCRFKLRTHGSFIQKAQSTPDTNVPNSKVNRYITNAGANICYEISRCMDATAGFNFNYINFRTKGFGFINHYQYTAPVALYYEMFPGFRVGPSYKYNYTDFFYNCVGDFNDHFGGLGLKGEINKYFCMNIHAGVIHRHINNNGGETTTFGGWGNFVYKFNRRLTLDVHPYRGFGVSGLGSSLLRTGIDGTLRYVYSRCLVGKLIASYSRTKYENSGCSSTANRRDNYSTFTGEVAYMPWTYLGFTGGYTYEDNSSNASGSSFHNNKVYLRAYLRY